MATDNCSKSSNSNFPHLSNAKSLPSLHHGIHDFNYHEQFKSASVTPTDGVRSHSPPPVPPRQYRLINEAGRIRICSKDHFNSPRNNRKFQQHNNLGSVTSDDDTQSVSTVSGSGMDFFRKFVQRKGKKSDSKAKEKKFRQEVLMDKLIGDKSESSNTSETELNDMNDDVEEEEEELSICQSMAISSVSGSGVRFLRNYLKSKKSDTFGLEGGVTDKENKAFNCIPVPFPPINEFYGPAYPPVSKKMDKIEDPEILERRTSLASTIADALNDQTFDYSDDNDSELKNLDWDESKEEEDFLPEIHDGFTPLNSQHSNLYDVKNMYYLNPLPGRHPSSGQSYYSSDLDRLSQASFYSPLSDNFSPYYSNCEKQFRSPPKMKSKSPPSFSKNEISSSNIRSINGNVDDEIDTSWETDQTPKNIGYISSSMRAHQSPSPTSTLRSFPMTLNPGQMGETGLAWERIVSRKTFENSSTNSSTTKTISPFNSFRHLNSGLRQTGDDNCGSWHSTISQLSKNGSNSNFKTTDQLKKSEKDIFEGPLLFGRNDINRENPIKCKKYVKQKNRSFHRSCSDGDVKEYKLENFTPSSQDKKKDTLSQSQNILLHV